MMKQYLYTALLILYITLGGCIPQQPLDIDYEENFEAIWRIIDERYCFLEEKGIDWDEVHDRYQQRLTENEVNGPLFFKLMSEMLNELKDGHVNLYSDFDISTYPIAPDPTTGLNIYARSRHLSGRLMVSGGMRYGRYRTKDEAINFGYISYGSFSNNIGNMGIILQIFEGADAIILDLRGNGGGSLSYTDKLLSYFVTEKTLVGYTVHKTGPGHHDFSKPKAQYITPSTKWTMTKQPIIILQDRSSYSATNDFLYKVGLARNVTRIGEVSGGGAGMPATAELPNGWRLRYSAVKSYDKDMKLLEGGVPPDIEIHNESFYINPAAGDDILMAAIKHIYQLKGLPLHE